MPNTSEIVTAAWRLLAADAELAALCAVVKGRKRPSTVKGAAVTVETDGLERGPGEGIWTCTLTVVVYVPLLAGRSPDFVTMDGIAGRVRALLADAEPELEGGKLMPLIEDGGTSADWDETHEGEARRELYFGVVMVAF